MGLDTLVKTSECGDGNNVVDIVNSLHWYITILPLMEMAVVKNSTNFAIFSPSIFSWKICLVMFRNVFVKPMVILNTVWLNLCCQFNNLLQMSIMLPLQE